MHIQFDHISNFYIEILRSYIFMNTIISTTQLADCKYSTLYNNEDIQFYMNGCILSTYSYKPGFNHDGSHNIWICKNVLSSHIHFFIFKDS